MRAPLDDAFVQDLAERTATLNGLTVGQVRARWKNAKACRRDLTAVLRTMCHGREICMYCSDAQGTAIDHYEPLGIAPVRAFDWANHLLTCTSCNSFHKRQEFPLDAAGQPLLLDPTTDDPWDHLRLMPTTGQYQPLTDRGVATVATLGLNRDLLARGRRAAWLDAEDHVIAIDAAIEVGDQATAQDRQFRLFERPNLDAFYSMVRFLHEPGIGHVLDAQVLNAVEHREALFRGWLHLD